MIVQIDTVYRYNIMSSKLQQTFLTILSSCFFSVGCIICFLQQMAPYHCLLILMAFHSCHVSVCTPACVWNASHKVCKRLVISGLVPFSSFESFFVLLFLMSPLQAWLLSRPNPFKSGTLGVQDTHRRIHNTF